MVSKLHHRLALVVLVALAGCGSVEMSMDDLPGSDVSVVLTEEATVYVPRPVLSKDAAATLDDERHPRAKFTKTVQSAMVRALERSGVAASASDKDADSTLRIRITGFGRGSGAAGYFFRGGVEYSSIDGTVSLETPGGKRGLAIEGAGSESGDSDAGDRTAENINAFATAIAARITG